MMAVRYLFKWRSGPRAPVRRLCHIEHLAVSTSHRKLRSTNIPPTAFSFSSQYSLKHYHLTAST